MYLLWCVNNYIWWTVETALSRRHVEVWDHWIGLVGLRRSSGLNELDYTFGIGPVRLGRLAGRTVAPVLDILHGVRIMKELLRPSFENALILGRRAEMYRVSACVFSETCALNFYLAKVFCMIISIDDPNLIRLGEGDVDIALKCTQVWE